MGRRPIRSDSRPSSAVATNCMAEKTNTRAPKPIPWAPKRCAYSGRIGMMIPKPIRSISTVRKITPRRERLAGIRGYNLPCDAGHLEDRRRLLTSRPSSGLIHEPLPRTFMRGRFALLTALALALSVPAVVSAQAVGDSAVKQDRKDVRHDRKDIRHDTRDIRQDRRDI